MMINNIRTLITNPKKNGFTCAYFDIAGDFTAFNKVNKSYGITTCGTKNATGETPGNFTVAAAGGTQVNNDFNIDS